MGVMSFVLRIVFFSVFTLLFVVVNDFISNNIGSFTFHSPVQVFVVILYAFPNKLNLYDE